MRIALYAPESGAALTPESFSDVVRRSDADLFVGAEYLLFADHGGRMYPLENDERKEHLDALCAVSNGRIVIAPMLWTKDTRFYNSAPIAYDGSIVGERYKQHESIFESVLGDVFGIRFSPAVSKPVMQVNSLSIRVEICLDFPFISDVCEADIHALCANGLYGDLHVSGRWRARDGGAALIVNNQRSPLDDKMAAWHRVHNRFIPYIPQESTREMRIYEVDA